MKGLILCVCVFQCPASLSTQVTGTLQACWQLEVWCGAAGSRDITLRMRTVTRRSTGRPSPSECLPTSVSHHQHSVWDEVFVFVLALILWRVEWKKSSRTRWREWRKSRRRMRPWSSSACSTSSPGEHFLSICPSVLLGFFKSMIFFFYNFLKTCLQNIKVNFCTKFVL